MATDFRRCTDCTYPVKKGSEKCWRHQLVDRADAIKAATSEDVFNLDRAQLEKLGRMAPHENN